MTMRFLAFEGVEGSGKSTQARLLAEALRARGEDVVLTFEPGDTAAGEALRDLLLRRPAPLTPMTEALLFCADRAQHVAEVIRPALEAGCVVITDRYAASTWVYQGWAGGLGAGNAQTLNDLATGGLYPDLTFVLDLDPADGFARKRGRPLGLEGLAAADERPGGSDADRMESRALRFHNLVREGYLAWAERHGRTATVLDASLPPEALHEAILARALGEAEG